MHHATKKRGLGAMDDLRMALSLLTRLPVRCPDDKPLAQAVWCYPVVGLILGVCLAPVLWLAPQINLPSLANGLLVIAVLSVLTGALHEDGLADVADGFGGGAERTRKLDIMKDSRMGSYGTLALILVVLFKASLIGALMDRYNSGITLACLMAVLALSRGLIPFLMRYLPPARPDGLARWVGRPTGARTLLGGFIVVVIVVALSDSLPAPALGLVVVSILTVFLIGWLSMKQINGITGDVLGASMTLCEATGLAVLVGGAS